MRSDERMIGALHRLQLRPADALVKHSGVMERNCRIMGVGDDESRARYLAERRRRVSVLDR